MMFTKEQGQELIDNTTNGWTSLNGVNGRIFLNKTNYSKSIFLPAGGFWRGPSYDAPKYACIYWSSTFSSTSTAWYIQLESNQFFISYTARYDGLLISPVVSR